MTRSASGQQVDLVVVGGGNMGGAILQGVVRSGLLPPTRAAVVEPDDARRGAFGQQGHPTAPSLEVLPVGLSREAVLLLAVKPQTLPAVQRGCAPLAQGRLVVSILAGATTQLLERALRDGDALPRVVRAMPNTPALVGKGVTALTPGASAMPEDIKRARRLFEPLGAVIQLDEALMDAFTAVAGSGPAYLFRFVEALAQGAERAGFDVNTAADLARATTVGAAALLEAEPDASPAALRRRVTSKGGTTEAALETLERGGFEELLAQAVVAARDRGGELGKALESSLLLDDDNADGRDQ